MKKMEKSDPVKSTVSTLAAACLQKTLDQGGAIEIPSLGIKIQLVDEERKGGPQNGGSK